MKTASAALSISIMALCAFVSAQEPLNLKNHPCLVVARYGTEGLFAYRDQYGVPLEHVQPSYNNDELNAVMKDGIKVVVYDPREHESFYEARQSCFVGPGQPPH